MLFLNLSCSAFCVCFWRYSDSYLLLEWQSVGQPIPSLSCWFWCVISAHIRRWLSLWVPVRVPGLSLPRQASPRLKGHGIPCSCTDCGFGHTKEGWTAQKTRGHTSPPVLRTQLPTASLCLTLLRLSWRQQGNSCLVVKDSWFHWVPTWSGSDMRGPGLLSPLSGL